MYNFEITVYLNKYSFRQFADPVFCAQYI